MRFLIDSFVMYIHIRLNHGIIERLRWNWVLWVKTPMSDPHELLAILPRLAILTWARDVINDNTRDHISQDKDSSKIS